MFAPALWRNRGNRAFHDLQQRLLHAFARHIAGDRWVVRLAGDLINLVDINDATLGAFHVVFRRLQQFQDDVFHVFADIACFGQRGGIGHGKGHIQNARQGLGQKRFAAAGGPDQQDVRL